MSRYALHHGRCLEVLSDTYHDCCMDSVVCDPPYGLKFMGVKWDYTIPSVADWNEHLRVLKPGGYLLAFASPRTQHRMACNIEDAGFEIRDSIAWMYGQGMPKSGTLKPAHEPIIVARKPFLGTVKVNVDTYGVGALNIEECRIHTTDNLNGGAYAKNGSERTDAWGESNGFRRNQGLEYVQPTGRYPANIIHDGSEEVVELFPNNNPGCKPHRVTASAESVAALQAKGWGFAGSDKVAGYDDGDDLSAARFFYCAKPNKRDRNEGTKDGNQHPTVKPTELMRYLVRLVTPAGGTVLDGFMGSGSTGKASILEGRNFVGIDLDEANVVLAKQRIEHVWSTK